MKIEFKKYLLFGCPSGGCGFRHWMYYNVRHLVLSLGSAQTLASQLDCLTPLASTPPLFTPWLYTSALIILFTARSASFNITNLVGPEEKTSEPIALPFTFPKKLKISLFHVEVVHSLRTYIYVCRFSLPERTQRGRGYQAETLATQASYTCFPVRSTNIDIGIDWNSFFAFVNWNKQNHFSYVYSQNFHESGNKGIIKVRQRSCLNKMATGSRFHDWSRVFLRFQVACHWWIRKWPVKIKSKSSRFFDLQRFLLRICTN